MINTNTNIAKAAPAAAPRSSAPTSAAGGDCTSCSCAQDGEFSGEISRWKAATSRINREGEWVSPSHINREGEWVTDLRIDRNGEWS